MAIQIVFFKVTEHYTSDCLVSRSSSSKEASEEGATARMLEIQILQLSSKYELCSSKDYSTTHLYIIQSFSLAGARMSIIPFWRNAGNA